MEFITMSVNERLLYTLQHHSQEKKMILKDTEVEVFFYLPLPEKQMISKSQFFKHNWHVIQCVFWSAYVGLEREEERAMELIIYWIIVLCP